MPGGFRGGMGGELAGGDRERRHEHQRSQESPDQRDG
jgi:hypothetical protein